jgi:L,D-peptidoglycan transpeptidase YkuD (ErfK/YbiS/YcfS/YnhG family)
MMLLAVQLATRRHVPDRRQDVRQLVEPRRFLPYVRLRCGDWWVEDSRSAAYNTFQRIGCRRKPPFRVTTPDLSTSPRAYAHLAVVEYNMHPVVPNRGSGIFLHVQIGKATSGCISLRRPALVRVLRWLDADALPQLAIGRTASLRMR